MPINPFQESPTPKAGYLESEMEDEEIELEDEELDEEEDEDIELEDPYGHLGHYENLTHLFDEDELKKLGSRIITHVQADERTREIWTQNAVKGLSLLGLDLSDASGAIVEGACHATHPLILETAIKFQSKASTELLPANGPADTRIIGKKTPEKTERALRVKQHLNYQLTEQMTEFYPDSERCYLYSAIFGDGFKKTYFDPDLERPVSGFVPAHLFVVSNNTPSLDRAERYTEIMPLSERTVQNRMASGYYKTYETVDSDELEPNGSLPSTSIVTLKATPIELGEFADAFNRIIGVQSGPAGDGYVLYEHYCYMDFKSKPSLKDTHGRKVPYCVTVDKESGLVLSIRRDWSQSDPLLKKRNSHFTDYSYIPSFGFYSFGLIHLLGNIQMVMTAMMRSLVDAGQFANLQGGYVAKGARITGPTTAWQMGEYRVVEGIAGQPIRDFLLPHQFKEPSAVVQAMLQWLDGRGGQFADATQEVVSNSQSYGPVGTTMALLDAASKLYASIYKRFHKSQSNELKIIARLNYEFMGEEESYPFEINELKDDPKVSTGGSVLREDYDPSLVDICPTSDPNVSSQAHRVAIANAKLDGLMKIKGIDPNLPIDFEPVIKDFIRNLDMQADISELFIPQDEAQPLGPLEDIVAMVHGKPIKSFPGQNHSAHVMLKQNWLQDPDQGMSLPMQKFQPILLANIQEHQIMGYQEKIDAMVTGVASDPATKDMLMARASGELKKMSEVAKSQGSPEETVAKAVQLEAETKARKQAAEEKDNQFDNILKLVEQVIGLSREQNRQAETESKVDVEQISQLKDMLLGLKQLDIKEKEVQAKSRKE